MIEIVDLNVELAWGTFIIFYDFERTFLTDCKVLFSVTDPMWTEAENNFDQFLDKFIMHELTKDENDNSNNNVSKSNPVSRLLGFNRDHNFASEVSIKLSIRAK